MCVLLTVTLLLPLLPDDVTVTVSVPVLVILGVGVQLVNVHVRQSTNNQFEFCWGEYGDQLGGHLFVETFQKRLDLRYGEGRSIAY